MKATHQNSIRVFQNSGRSGVALTLRYFLELEVFDEKCLSLKNQFIFYFPKMATSSVEALVLNSTMIQDADEDLVIQAKKAKNSASEKLKELKRKFEIKAAGTKAEIAVIKVR